MESFGWKLRLFSSPNNSCLFFLLHQGEEGKGEDGDGGNGVEFLTIWELGWHDMSIIVISPLRNISHHDWVPLSGMTWRVFGSNRLDHLVSS